jgi:hypothetical protein
MVFLSEGAHVSDWVSDRHWKSVAAAAMGHPMHAGDMSLLVLRVLWAKPMPGTCCWLLNLLPNQASQQSGFTTVNVGSGR